MTHVVKRVVQHTNFRVVNKMFKLLILWSILSRSNELHVFGLCPKTVEEPFDAKHGRLF